MQSLCLWRICNLCVCTRGERRQPQPKRLLTWSDSLTVRHAHCQCQGILLTASQCFWTTWQRPSHRRPETHGEVTSPSRWTASWLMLSRDIDYKATFCRHSTTAILSGHIISNKRQEVHVCGQLTARLKNISFCHG